MTPDEYCQHKAAASGSSFYYSFLFLPPPRRRAITALYAFCREVDDAVDEVSDATLAGRRTGSRNASESLSFPSPAGSDDEKRQLRLPRARRCKRTGLPSMSPCQ